MKKLWTYIKDVFSSDPSRWPRVKRYNDWLDKEEIWFLLLIFMLFAMCAAKLLTDRIETLEYRIKRVEELPYQKSEDVALASDMLNLEHIFFDEDMNKQNY